MRSAAPAIEESAFFCGVRSKACLNPVRLHDCLGLSCEVFIRNRGEVAGVTAMDKNELLLALLAEGFTQIRLARANLQQSLKGVRAKQALGALLTDVTMFGNSRFTPRIGNMRCAVGSKGEARLVCPEGKQFLYAPEKGKATEAAWRADLALLEKRTSRPGAERAPRFEDEPSRKLLRMLYGIAFHDIYHAGQSGCFAA